VQESGKSVSTADRLTVLLGHIVTTTWLESWFFHSNLTDRNNDMKQIMVLRFTLCSEDPMDNE